MSDFGDWIAKSVVNVYEVQDDDEEIEDILDDLEPEDTVVICRDARPIDYDHLFPFGKDFVRAEVYRESMQEYCEWIGKAVDLIRDLYLQLLNAYDPKEIGEFTERLEDFGIEVGE